MVHGGEVIGPPQTIVNALSKAMREMGMGGGGQPVYSPNITLQIGRRTLRKVIAETLADGTTDGDVVVNSQSTYFSQ